VAIREQNRGEYGHTRGCLAEWTEIDEQGAAAVAHVNDRQLGEGVPLENEKDSVGANCTQQRAGGRRSADAK